MSFGIGSLTQQANQALSPLQQLQHDLLKQYQAASTGKRINSAADDPSGLAIATSLQTQSASFDQGSRNAQDAGNALNVAEGALQTTTDALQSLRSLASQAVNDFLSPNDRQNLQAVANQLVRQINTDAQNANFNGTPLLNGTFGSSPATPPNATVTSNADLAGGSNLVSNVSAAPTAQAGTIGLSVVNNGTAVDVKFTDTATGTTTDLGTQAPGSTVTVNGTTFTLGTTSNLDNGTTATIQIQAASAGSNAPNAQVQTGANEGATTAVALPNATSSALFIKNVDFSSSASATNAIGQIDEALNATTSARANLGAQGVAINDEINANNVASNALTASASNIEDASAPQTSTELYKLIVQQQISLETLRNANTEFGFLNRFFNTGA
ncbi:MAG: flagellin [Candidatus Eremiobacteraeota bacterium]|nr:flagellin [Candidatus Eremiobacteraeota bacterium]